VRLKPKNDGSAFGIGGTVGYPFFIQSNMHCMTTLATCLKSKSHQILLVQQSYISLVITPIEFKLSLFHVMTLLVLLTGDFSYCYQPLVCAYRYIHIQHIHHTHTCNCTRAYIFNTTFTLALKVQLVMGTFHIAHLLQPHPDPWRRWRQEAQEEDVPQSGRLMEPYPSISQLHHLVFRGRPKTLQRPMLRKILTSPKWVLWPKVAKGGQRWLVRAIQV
jgi:hypothetical protein